MELLYSNMLPLSIQDGQKTFIECFNELLVRADRIDIAVGYISRASLNELDELITVTGIKEVRLNIGMYYFEGMPEGTYHAAVSMDKKWHEHGIGEVRMVRSLKFHGKLYAFYHEGTPFAAFIGSHNLGAIKLEANNLRQYEISAVTYDQNECEAICELINRLSMPDCSANIQELTGIQLIHDVNRALVDQEYVTKITQDEVEAYQSKRIGVSFEIPIKVPRNHLDSSLRGSNINVCYARGRKRVWWENEIVVDKKICELPGYPEYQKPFMAVTDDGWKFQVLPCGTNNKNLYSKDDLKIMGRWIKGRLVAAGLVEPVNQVEADTDYKGLITEEMLEQYGRKTITLSKTSLKTVTDDGAEIDVWVLSFLPENAVKEGDE